MALSEGNPEPSTQACLNTCGTWPLHLQDHVNCLCCHFTQCWIKAGVPEVVSLILEMILPLLMTRKEDLGSYGNHAWPHPFLPRGLLLRVPYAAHIWGGEEPVVAALCHPRTPCWGGSSLLAVSLKGVQWHLALTTFTPFSVTTFDLDLLFSETWSRLWGSFTAERIRPCILPRFEVWRQRHLCLLFPVASLLILACSTCRNVNSCHDVGRRQAVGWGGAPHVQDSHFLLCHLTLVTCQSAFIQLARASHFDVCEKDVSEPSSMFCWDFFPISHLLIAH